MSLPAPAPGQERQNRKLLEQLEEQKKRLRQATQTTTPAVPAKESTQQSVVPMPSPASVMQSSSTDTQHMNAAQRAALQHAHANSVGYFITQESAFGNLILPVLPRFEKSDKQLIKSE